MNVAEKVGSGFLGYLSGARDAVWRNFMAKPRELEDDLEWLQKQIAVKGLPCKAFFEKYLIVGVDNHRIRELIDAYDPQDICEAFLQPKTLFVYPQKRENEALPSLFEDELCDQIAEFCFPNGVFVERVNYDFSKDLSEQEEVVREIVNEILYKQKENLREQMYFFTINGIDVI